MSSDETMTPKSDCRHIEPLLDDFVDGRLTAGDQRRVEAHLTGDEDMAGCETCGEHLASLEELLRQVDALPRSLPPAADLWPEVAPRLTTTRFSERSRRATAGWPRRATAGWPRRATAGWPRRATAGWPYWLRQAAAAVVFMALGGVLSQLLPLIWRGDATTPVAVEAPGGHVPDAGFALAEADFLRAKETLWSAVYSSHDAASPETREVVERNLAVIASAIRELRTALEADPGNHQLEGLLLAQHRSEIGLLQRLARATEI